MTAPLPSQTITGTTAADIRSTTPGVAALVETFQAGDTITLNNDGDYALGGDGADVIVIGGTASVSLANSVVAGYGADTITIGTAAASLAAVGFSVAANQGNDSISITAGGTFNSAFVGGGLGADTIAVQGITQYINSNIKGGDIGDSITITSGALTNTIVQGNKGADTIFVGTTAATNGSVGGGEGHDTITIDGVASWINGGAGLDSLRFSAGASFSTLAGGGLADTIIFGGTFAGGRIYGDGVGVTTAGTGTGGTADGNDLIGSTATDIAAAASVWGAGGNDTIRFGTAGGTAALLNGGDGADFITLVGSTAAAASLIGGNGADTLSIVAASGAAWLQGDAGQDSIKIGTTAALTIAGGAGLDTIVFTNGDTSATNVDGGSQTDLIYVGTAAVASALNAFGGSGTIAGGDGADTIAALGFASAGSINGGAGNDSILLSNISASQNNSFAAVGTINGGAGTDRISFATTANGQALGSSAISSGIATIVYEAGDVITLAATAYTALAGAAANGLVNVGSSAGNAFTAGGGITAAGQISVYSDGTDTFFAIAVSADSGIAFKVSGADLVNTTGVGLFAQSAVGFTFAATSGTGVSITLA